MHGIGQLGFEVELMMGPCVSFSDGPNMNDASEAINNRFGDSCNDKEGVRQSVCDIWKNSMLFIAGINAIISAIPVSLKMGTSMTEGNKQTEFELRLAPFPAQLV